MGVWWINNYVFAMRLQFIICLFNATSNGHLISCREGQESKWIAKDCSDTTVCPWDILVSFTPVPSPPRACTQGWALYYRFHISSCLFSWFIDRRGFFNIEQGERLFVDVTVGNKWGEWSFALLSLFPSFFPRFSFVFYLTFPLFLYICLPVCFL